MENQESSVNPPKTDPLSPQKTVIKVLIIDDELTLCHLLKDILETYDFECAFAENGENALKLMPEFKPTVALVDFRLGEITGLELAQSLKKIDEDLPVILMTAYPSLDLAVKAIQNDIYDFLAKPVDQTYLLKSITKATEKRTLTEENKRLIAFLKQNNAELAKLNRMKSKFLSIVTHDLRIPLTSIRGFAELLEITKDLSKEDKAKCFSMINKSVERMNGLIANLLDVVSIEAGKLRVETSLIDFSSVCQELKESLTPVANSKKIALEWQVPKNPIMLMGDTNRLIQLLNNFISNALKHTTPEKGKITVVVTIDPPVSPAPKTSNERLILIEVIDNGEGIAPEDQSKIFEQFFQVESSATRREGLGLGLNISKEIVHAHKGEIGVSSEGLEKGARFWFTLPLAS